MRPELDKATDVDPRMAVVALEESDRDGIRAIRDFFDESNDRATITAYRRDGHAWPRVRRSSIGMSTSSESVMPNGRRSP
jgi:hypothetical protein